MTKRTAKGFSVTCDECPGYEETLESSKDAQDVGDAHGSVVHGDMFADSVNVRPVF